MSNDWKSIIKGMHLRIGEAETLRLLVIAGMAPSTAQLISSLKYGSEPKFNTLKRISKAEQLSKEGAA